MPPAWKVRRGHLVIGSSVRPSVCPSVCNSVPLTIKVQYLKFGWVYNYQTWTVSSSKGCSHFTDITRPWGVGQGQNVGLRDFCHNWTLLPPGASVFHKHMSSFKLNYANKSSCSSDVDHVSDAWFHYNGSNAISGSHFPDFLTVI